MNAELFLADVKGHELAVIKNEGVYRHLRFRNPKSSNMFFDLVTWPGFLAYSGDMGCYARSWEAKHSEGSWKEPTFAWVTDFKLSPELNRSIPAIIDSRPGLNLCGVDEAGLLKLEALRGKHVLIEETN